MLPIIVRLKMISVIVPCFENKMDARMSLKPDGTR